MFVGKLVELPSGQGVHLDERDAAAAPLPLRFVDGEEGLEEQVHDAPGDGRRVQGQAGQQVVHVAHIPKLERTTQMTLHYILQGASTQQAPSPEPETLLPWVFMDFGHISTTAG